MLDKVREVAYLNWVNRGQPIGDALVDWRAAYSYIIHGDSSLLAKTPGEKEFALRAAAHPNAQVSTASRPFPKSSSDEDMDDTDVVVSRQEDAKPSRQTSIRDQVLVNGDPVLVSKKAEHYREKKRREKSKA